MPFPGPDTNLPTHLAQTHEGDTPALNYLAREANKGNKEAQYYLQVRQETRRAIGNGPIKIYYPGIGGSQESIDIKSAFLRLDADEVFGIDIFPFAHDNHLNPKAPDQVDFPALFDKFIAWSANVEFPISDVVIRDTDLQWEREFTFEEKKENYCCKKKN